MLIFLDRQSKQSMHVICLLKLNELKQDKSGSSHGPRARAWGAHEWSRDSHLFHGGYILNVDFNLSANKLDGIFSFIDIMVNRREMYMFAFIN